MLEEELIPDGADVSPLFGGPLPHGSYYHSGVGSIIARTRELKKNDSLFADDVWPGSIVMADTLANTPSYCENRIVLELGAGAALPSLVCAKLRPKHLVISDYPDQTILDSISMSLEENHIEYSPGSSLSIVGHDWGTPVDSLIQPLKKYYQNLLDKSVMPRFDLIILSELLWKDTYPLHRNLLNSVDNCLRLDTKGTVLVTFAHRPSSDSTGHTSAHDMEFFDIAKSEYNFEVQLLQTEGDMIDSVSGSENCGSDSNMCVFLYSMTRNGK